MKKYFILFSLLLGSILVNAQEKVGVGTNNPTKTLDINGEFRIRDLRKQEGQGVRFLTADQEGNIGSYGVEVDHVSIGASEAKNYKEVKANTKPEISQPVELDLPEMTTTATIPANKKVTLIVAYSLPIGEDRVKTEKSQYFGIRFYKEMGGVKEPVPEMTRKFTTTNGQNWNMISITNQYVETFDVQPYDRKVTFSLEGFVETKYDGGNPHNVRFLMFAPKGTNYNWGYAYISYEILEVKVGK